MTINEVLDLQQDHIKILQPYSSARDEFKADPYARTYWMDANEHPYDLHGRDLNRYPDPNNTELREVAAKKWQLTADQVFVGNGSDEALDLIIKAFCTPQKDAIVYFPPTYGMYKVLGQMYNTECVEIPLHPGVSFPEDANIPQHAKVIFVCRPNNPTGTLVSKAWIEQLCSEQSAIIVVDEAYIDFCLEETVIGLLSQYPNLIITRTASKAIGAAGLRLGFAFAHPEVIAILQKLKAPYNINAITQSMGARILERNLENETSDYINRRDKLIQVLQNKLGFPVEYDTQTNFILVRFDNPQFVYQKLLQKGIIVRDRSSQPFCDGCLRITVGTDFENQLLIETLSESLNQLPL